MTLYTTRLHLLEQRRQNQLKRNHTLLNSNAMGGFIALLCIHVKKPPFSSTTARALKWMVTMMAYLAKASGVKDYLV